MCAMCIQVCIPRCTVLSQYSPPRGSSKIKQSSSSSDSLAASVSYNFRWPTTWLGRFSSDPFALCAELERNGTFDSDVPLFHTFDRRNATHPFTVNSQLTEPTLRRRSPSALAGTKEARTLFPHKLRIYAGSPRTLLHRLAHHTYSARAHLCIFPDVLSLLAALPNWRLRVVLVGAVITSAVACGGEGMLKVG